MRTILQVLSEDERARVHELSLEILAKTGVRVDTALGRRILRDAGAEVDENTRIVRFPRTLVEESLRLAPSEFTLGARRAGWDLRMNQDDCTLLMDGEAVFVLDRETGERRPGILNDWLETTRLIDALDEVGVYWNMVHASDVGDTMSDFVGYLRRLFSNFSKHVQDGISSPEQAPWLLEVLQVIFGGKEAIRRRHPLSFLLCPLSPLVIEGPYTDAYLALVGWDMPVGIMPMPLMGGTAPGSLIATTVLGNCEVLAMLCLVQAAAAGTPIIYAPILAIMDPRNGRLSGGAIERGVLGAAVVEMGRYYGLPVEASGMGTDHHIPSIQSGYEAAMRALLPTLSWPDILVGPGLLGGSMTLSQEQLLIDVEIFRMCRRASQGIITEGKWLEDVIARVGPSRTFLSEKSTAQGIHGGELYLSKFGVHNTYEAWAAAGKRTLIEESRDKVKQILAAHQPLPLDDQVERELNRIQERAQQSPGKP